MLPPRRTEIKGVAYLRDASFDLVITDIKMEGLNGFEVMEYIAAHTPHTPVIVITGYASTTSAVEALRQGAYDYIAKPFEIEIIRFSIERALEKSRLQQEIKGIPAGRCETSCLRLAYFQPQCAPHSS